MISFVSYVEAHIRGNTSYLNREARAYVRPPLASIILQPRQPLPGILDFGLAGVGVLPEVEELYAVLHYISKHFYFCVTSFWQSRARKASLGPAI